MTVGLAGHLHANTLSPVRLQQKYAFFHNFHIILSRQLASVAAQWDATLNSDWVIIIHFLI